MAYKVKYYGKTKSGRDKYTMITQTGAGWSVSTYTIKGKSVRTLKNTRTRTLANAKKEFTAHKKKFMKKKC